MVVLPARVRELTAIGFSKGYIARVRFEAEPGARKEIVRKGEKP